LKVPRQYLLVLVEVRLVEGKALGSEEGKAKEEHFVMSRGNNFTAYDRNFDTDV
jgi:hypothetical protein